MENSLDCSVMCMCRCGWCMGTLVELELDLELEESCRTSSCRIAVLEVSVKTVMPLLRMELFSEMNNLEK